MIRKLVESDYERAKELVMEVHEIHVRNRPDIYQDGNPLPYEFFLGALESNYNFVFEQDDKIIGLVMGDIQKSRNIPILKKRKVLFIDDIVVDKRYRHKGIGKRLYYHVRDIAKKAGIDSVELNVWAFNNDAIGFYKKLGLRSKNIKFEDKL